MATADATLVRRAAANLARGLGGALPLALLPPLLGRLLADDEFAVWVLVVQLASYVVYFEFGVQMAVSKTSASAYAGGDLQRTAGAVGAGVRLLARTAIAGMVLVGALTLLLPMLFDVPSELVVSAQISLVLLGLGAAFALPGAAVYGALLGVGRNGVVAMAVVASRILSVGLTLVGAWLGWPLWALAAALGSGSLLNGVLPFLAARYLGLPARPRRSSIEDRREIVGLTTTFAVFTVATLLVTGIDVLVVGLVDYGQVAAYGLGASLVAVVSAAYTVMFTVLLPAFAESTADGDRSAARRLVARSTTLSSWILCSGLVFGVALAPPAMRLWAGEYADDAEPIFLVLLVAATIRLSALPLVQFIIGVGDHNQSRGPAIGEATSNLALSVFLGMVSGALGVAVATLIAASGALLFYLFRRAPGALGDQVSRSVRIRSYLVPALVAAAAVATIRIGDAVVTVGVCIAVGVVAVLASRAAIRSGATDAAV